MSIQMHIRKVPQRAETPHFISSNSPYISLYILKRTEIYIVFQNTSSYCIHFTNHILSSIISGEKETVFLHPIYLQFHFNRVSLKPIHQPEKFQIECFKNTRRKINRKLNYSLLDISTPSEFFKFHFRSSLSSSIDFLLTRHPMV